MGLRPTGSWSSRRFTSASYCFGRATLGADCRAGSAPRLDANPFPRFEAREEGAAAAGFKRLPPLPPPPALY